MSTDQSDSEKERCQKERIACLGYQVDLGLRMLNYAFISNAGAIGITFGYVGKWGALPSCWKFSLWLLFFGVILVLVGGGCAYFYHSQLTIYATKNLGHVLGSKGYEKPGDFPPATLFTISIVLCALSILMFILAGMNIAFTF